MYNTWNCHCLLSNDTITSSNRELGGWESTGSSDNLCLFLFGVLAALAVTVVDFSGTTLSSWMLVESFSNSSELEDPAVSVLLRVAVDPVLEGVAAMLALDNLVTGPTLVVVLDDFRPVGF